MPLVTGSTLGPYAIEDLLGAGGMGEVYRARDTKLGRSVAVKVLPEAFLSDGDRIARFAREAKMLAALNHPHIAALYNMEEAASRHFLVMELVEGETLADRLARGPMRQAAALAIGRQIAEALEAAHEKGVVHRDLKPANIKITNDEVVKVLDFGLAKALESPSQTSNIANSPTLSMMATEAGLVLGTAAYMSPEQAKGLPADHRSDIFSFGAVLYEMLTGRSPFRGETAPDILASVIVRDPDLQSLPNDLHPRVVDVVRRCLEKPPKRRWQAAGDLRAEIESILAAPAMPAAREPRAGTSSVWARVWPAIAAAAAASALTWLVVRQLAPSPSVPAVARFAIPLDGQQFSSVGGRVVAIAPDASAVTFVASGALYVRPMSSLEARQVQGVRVGQGANSPTFSPDGRFIAFWSPSATISRIATIGGAPIPLCPAPATLSGMSWSEEGILFGQPEGIMMVPAEGGPSRLIAKAEGDEFLFGPEMLPGGRAIMFTVGNGQSPDLWDRASIVVQSLADGRRTRVIDGGSDARYLPTGHLVYALGGTVYGVQFDLEQLKTVGTPVPVLEGVMRSFAGATGAAQYGVSNNGALVYVPGPPGASPSQFELVMTDRKGAIQPVGLPPGQYLFPRVSPGGGSIAYQADDGKETSIWVHDLKSGRAQRRLTFGGTNRFPIWSPDGQRVAFQSDRGGDRGIFVQRADGTGAAERLTKADGGAAHIPSSWSPAGTHLLFDEQKGPDFVLRVLSLRDRTTASFGDVVSKSLTTGVFSPDGKRVAYSIAPVGPNDPTIMVQPFPATGDRSQIYSQTGDNPHHPQWSQDGTQLFFVPRVGGFEAVDIVTTPTFAFGNPVPVPRAFPLAPPTAPRTYDLTADGRVLSAASPSGVPGRNMQPIHVVLSWFSELTGRVPAR